MTKNKSTKRALLMSALALLMCVSMLIGSTYAWFTDSVTSGSNVIKSGNLDLVVEYTLGDKNAEGEFIWKDLDGANDLFQKGLWEPGHTEVVALRVKNNGSLALKYVANMNIVNEVIGKNKAGGDIVLSEILTVTSITQQANAIGNILLGMVFNGSSNTDTSSIKPFKSGNVLASDQELDAGESHYIIITVDMAETVGNEANHNGINAPSIEFGINFLATQYTSESDSFGSQYDKDATYPALADTWDGTADTTWYNDTDTEFTLTTAEELAGFALLTGTSGNQFEGKTVYLGNDLDLTTADDSSFAPIGSTGERDDRGRLITKSFKGTFDGKGHTIKNLYQSGWDFGYEWGQYGSIGLFSELEGATVKNLVIEDFDCQVEGGDVAFIAGSATGECVFENIEIRNSSIGTYNNGIGSIIGWSGEGTYTLTNITVADDVVIGGLWGSFDSSIGGLIGQGEPGATYNFKNINVACRLDTYNDVTASYQYYLYRMTGMLIGRLDQTTTIDGSNYPDMSKYNITCENVTVTYGDWMNYHYCYGFNGSRYTRVESGYAYGGLDITDEGHNTTCTDHLLCLPFDGLFGGDQYGVRPITSYEGVTVNYPASYTPGT